METKPDPEPAASPTAVPLVVLPAAGPDGGTAGTAAESKETAQREACVMTRDAIHGLSASYFVDLNSTFEETTGLWQATSVWGNSEAQLEWAARIKSPAARQAFKVLAFCLLLTTAFEKPRIWNQIPHEVGWVSAILILLVFWAVFFLKTWCILPNKQLWFKGASEELWTLLLGVALVCSSVGVLLQASGGDETVLQTINGEIEFSRADLWLRAVRSYYLVYFSPKMRSGILSTFKIFWDLRAVFGLIMVCFLVHYFAYEAAMGTEDKDAAGLTQWQRNIGGESGDAKDGLWNMFILLTTANHPDIVMDFYNSSPVSILLLLSFMCTAFYFLMNLLLGVVYSAYQACYSDEIKINKALKSSILASAFHKLKVTVTDQDGDTEEGVDYAGFVRVVAFIQGKKHETFDGEWFDLSDEGALRSYCARVESVLGTKDRAKAPISRVWFDMLDTDGSGTVEPEEFQKLPTVMNAPLRRIDHASSSEPPVPRHPALHRLFVSGSLAGCRPEQLNAADPSSACFYFTWCNFVNLIVLLNVIAVVFADRSSFCHTWALGFEVLFVAVYLLDVLARAFAEATDTDCAAFFRLLSNWVDLGSALVLAVNLFCCGNGSEPAVRVAGTMLRCLRLGYTVPQLKRIGTIGRKVLVLVIPQFTVFLMVYFFFATVGMALFAGDTTKTLATGGPGDWSTTPWSGSAYGGTAYYYSLNFDNVGRAYFLLFTLMVQNNWSVTADGFQQTNTRWTRLYFLVFNVSVVMVMCNIFIASVMQYYSDLDKDDKELAEEKLKEANDLLHATEFAIADNKDKSTWYVKLKIEDDSILNAADEEDKADKEEAKQYSKNELAQNRGMLNDLPIPVCIQEASGSYTWANSSYKELVIPDHVLQSEQERAAVLKKPAIETKADILLQGQTDSAFLERDALGELRVRKIKELLAQHAKDREAGLLDPLETQHTERHGHTEEEPQGDKYCAVMLPLALLALQHDGTPATGAVIFLLPSKKSYRSKALDFISLDRDKNNTITFNEWVARFGDTPESAAAFNKYDTDGDRVISKAEFLARDAIKTQHDRKGPAATSHKHKKMEKMLAMEQARRAQERDSELAASPLDKSEAREQLKDLFCNADKNGSGAIDAQEMLELFSHFQSNPAALEEEGPASGASSVLALSKQVVADYGVPSETETEEGPDGQPVAKRVLDFDAFHSMVDENDFWPELGIVVAAPKQQLQVSKLQTVGDVRRALMKLFDDFDFDDDNELEQEEVFQMFHRRSEVDIAHMPDGHALIEDLIDVYGVSKATRLHFNEFAQALVECSWPPSNPKPLCEVFGLVLPKDVNVSLIWKMPRYKPGTELNEFNKLAWYRRMQASMFVRDATHNMTGTYYQRTVHNQYNEAPDKSVEGVSSIWADDPNSLEWMQLLRSGEYRTFFKIVSYLLVFATALERPAMWSEVPSGVGSAIAIGCLLAIWVVVWVYFKCMWPCRARWWRGSSEEYWLCGMCIALPLATFGVIYDIAEGDLESIDTIFGTLEIDRTAMALKVTRAYFVLFFSPTMRSNFISSLQIFHRLRHVVALIVIFYTVHYLAFVAVMSENQYKLNIGAPDGFVPDGLWSFFITLTTANHPDIVMNLYTDNQLSCLILLSFMALSFYFLMSLLLGVVCSAYNEIYAAACEKESRMEALILLEAFEMTKTRNPKEATATQADHLEAHAAILRSAGARAMQTILEDGLERSVRRPALFFDNLPGSASARLLERELRKAGVAVAVDQATGEADIFLPRDSYGKALGQALVFTQTLAPDPQAIQRQFPHAVAVSDSSLELPAIERKAWELGCELGEEEWGMDFDTFSEIVSLYGDGKGDNAELIRVWFDMMDTDGSGYIDYIEFKTLKKVLNSPLERRDISVERLNDQPRHPCMHWFAITARLGEPGQCLGLVGWESFVDVCTLVAVIWTVFVPPDDTCDEAYGFTIEMLWTLLFVADAVVTPMGMATKLDPFQYFKLWYRNLDVLAALGMVLAMALCAGDGSSDLRKVIGLVRCLRTFRLTYSVDALRTIVRCAQKVLILILPQLTMFLVVYYTFAVLGMAFFAGDVTRSVATSGPGDWSTAPWSGTAFGSANFYYRLNFDNLGNSIVTLFTLMVVNNWGVTVNGYEETSQAARWVRVYFFVVHIVLVWIYINVFISTIISYYDMFLEDEVDPSSSLIAKTLRHANERLAATKHRKGWVVLNVLEDNRTLFAGGSEDDAAAKAEEAALKAREKAQCRRILRYCPLPMYIQTSNGKFTFANDAYLTLEGLAREIDPATGAKLEDSPLKGLKDHPDPTKRVPHRVKTRAKHREEAMKESTKVSFAEEFQVEGFVGRERMIAHTRPCTLLSGLPGALTYLTAHKTYHDDEPAPAAHEHTRAAAPAAAAPAGVKADPDQEPQDLGEQF